jgi:hypothetical protein
MVGLFALQQSINMTCLYEGTRCRAAASCKAPHPPPLRASLCCSTGQAAAELALPLTSIRYASENFLLKNCGTVAHSNTLQYLVTHSESLMIRMRLA